MLETVGILIIQFNIHRIVQKINWNLRELQAQLHQPRVELQE